MKPNHVFILFRNEQSEQKEIKRLKAELFKMKKNAQQISYPMASAFNSLWNEKVDRYEALTGLKY